MFAIPKCLTHIYEYTMYESNTTNFVMLFYCLGQHVSTLTGLSSGPSNIQIFKLTMFKMHCGIPNGYLLTYLLHGAESFLRS